MGDTTAKDAEEYTDVIVIGAGVSGIDAAYRIKTLCPDRTFSVLERRPQLGGTWDLFKFPGVRSDTDLYTFGFAWYPWNVPQRMARMEDIVPYLTAAVKQEGLDEHIVYNTHVSKASFDSSRAVWTLVSEDGRVRTCSFLYMCGGYYDYDQGFTPEFKGVEDFETHGGVVVHPQHWGDTQYVDKKVVVIGSGATAVTIVPALAKQAEHVTMVQRSPTFIISDPKEDAMWYWLSPVLPAFYVYLVMRWKSIAMTMLYYFLMRYFPNWGAEQVMKGVRHELAGTMTNKEIETHFRPRYNPWDERICMVPDGDFFAAIRSKKASVVTNAEGIECFTSSGLRLKGGNDIDADVIVTATGLNVQSNFPFSTMKVTIDGKPVISHQKIMYRGIQLSGCPNFAFCVGYSNIAWTLKSELAGKYVCRLLNHMKKHNIDIAVPEADDSIKIVNALPLTSGYVKRANEKKCFPSRGHKQPFSLYDNYLLDRINLAYTSLTSKYMKYITVSTPNRGA